MNTELVAKNKEKIVKVGKSLWGHPIWSIPHNRRLRIDSINGEWLICLENDGTTKVETPLHLSQVNVY